MHTVGRFPFVAGVSSLLFARAFADGGMPITIINDNPDTVLVTAYDENVTPPAALLSSREINGFATIPLMITPGPDGTGHIRWNAVSADSFVGLCGHMDRPQLPANIVVHVYAKSNCHESQ
jgi:hypothetical protein